MKKFLYRLACITVALVAFMGFGGATPLAETQEDIAWDESYIELVGGTYEITDESLALKPNGGAMDLYLSLPHFEEYSVGEKAHIFFQIKSVDLASVKYDAYKVRTWGDIVVDYAFENGKWNGVHFDGTILQRNGKNTVLVRFTDIIANVYNKIEIANLQVDDDIFDTTDLFGGVEVIQYEGAPAAQMLGFVFVSGDEVVVYDGGYTGDGAELIKLINMYGRKVSGWFISHFHGDHVTALKEILDNNDIEIDTLYYDFPMSSSNLPEGKGSIDAFNAAVASHRDKINNVVQTKAGDEFIFEDMTIKVLNTTDATAPANNFGNNTTVVYKVETPGESLLLLGDLGDSGDRFMGNEYFRKEATSCRVISMAHHGQNGVTKYFYNQIEDIKVCLYSAPLWLYDVNHGSGLGTADYKTLEVRAWMREKGVRISLCTADGRIHFR